MTKVIHEVPAAHLVAAVLQSDVILGQLQRELYRALPGISFEELRGLFRDEVLRKEVTTGDEAEAAQALLDRMNQLRRQGLTQTQALRAVTDPTKAEDEDDVFRILSDDKWSGGSGG
jgi:hypothetical protein